MKKYKRTECQSRVIEGMSLVHRKLIEFKINSNSKLVVLRNNKIVKIKPKEEESH